MSIPYLRILTKSSYKKIINKEEYYKRCTKVLIFSIISECAEMVAGWILGIHGFWIVRVQVSLLVIKKDNQIFIRIQFDFTILFLVKIINYKLINNFHIFSWIGTAIAFEATVYWFESNRMLWRLKNYHFHKLLDIRDSPLFPVAISFNLTDPLQSAFPTFSKIFFTKLKFYQISISHHLKKIYLIFSTFIPCFE